MIWILFFIYLCTVVLGCEETEIPTAIMFLANGYTTACGDQLSQPVLRCHSRCGYEKKISPVVCKNLTPGTLDAIWECSTMYKFPDDSDLSLRKTTITCQRASENKIYANTCVLDYSIGKDSDDRTWVEWFMLVFVIAIGMFFFIAITGQEGVNFALSVCLLSMFKSSSRSGSSSSFANTRT